MQQSSPPSSRGNGVAAVALYLLTGYCGLVALGLLGIQQFNDRSELLVPRQIAPLYDLMAAHGIATLILYCAASVIRRSRAMRPAFARIILLFGAIVILVSTDRLIGMIYLPPVRKITVLALHERRGWAHIPLKSERQPNFFGTTDIQIDANGFRVEYGKPLRTLNGKNRILFLGDSVTFGLCRRASETYGARTIDLLNKSHPEKNFIEINAGVTGYDTNQEYDLLTHEGFEQNPRMVVLEFCLNDVTCQFDPARGADPEQHDEFIRARRPTHWSGWVRAAMCWSRQIQYGGDEQQAAFEIEHFQLNELLIEPPTPRVDAAWRRTMTELEKITTACREREVPLVIVGFPVLGQLVDAESSDAPQRRLRNFCVAHDVPFIDLLPVFKGNEPPSEERGTTLLFDQTHPTVLGNQIAAETLVDFLKKGRYIERYFN